MRDHWWWHRDRSSIAVKRPSFASAGRLRLLPAMLMRRCRQCRWMRRSRGEEQDEAQGRRPAASGCIASMCCACCQWSRLPKCSVVAGSIFHRLRPPSHLLYRLIAGICSAKHGHQSFPLLGHSPASTFICRVLKRVMFYTFLPN